MVSLKKKPRRIEIPVGEMVDGEIAVIIRWNGGNFYTGTIVQRYRNTLLAVGKISGEGWEDVFPACENWSNCEVRLLQPGDELIIS